MASRKITAVCLGSSYNDEPALLSFYFCGLFTATSLGWFGHGHSLPNPYLPSFPVAPAVARLLHSWKWIWAVLTKNLILFYNINGCLSYSFWFSIIFYELWCGFRPRSHYRQTNWLVAFCYSLWTPPFVQVLGCLVTYILYTLSVFSKLICISLFREAHESFDSLAGAAGLGHM